MSIAVAALMSERNTLPIVPIINRGEVVEQKETARLASVAEIFPFEYSVRNNTIPTG